MNNQIFFNLHSISNNNYFLDKIIIFCAEYLPYILILSVIIFIFRENIGEFDYRNPFGIIKKRFNNLFKIFAPVFISFIVGDILKNIFSSPRPFIEFKEIVKPLFIHGGMDSFPSGHSIFFMSLAVSSYFVNKKLGYFLFFCAVVIGFSRIISGVHYPIDIIWGYILGAFISIIFNKLTKNIK